VRALAERKVPTLRQSYEARSELQLELCSSRASVTRGVMTPGGSNNVATALRAALRSLGHQPSLAAIFLFATLGQGALQGAMIWALREVLVMLSGQRGGEHGALLFGSLAVFVIWLLRSGGVYSAQMFAARLAHRVEVEWMSRVLEKLMTLSVRFFDKSSRGDLAMTAYVDVRSVRAVTLQFGQLVLYVSQLAGLMVAAWLMSPKLALIGLVAVPIGAIPVYWLGQQISEAARRERKEAVSLQDSYLQVSAGIRVIKVSGGEHQIMNRAREMSEKLWYSVLRQTQTQGLARLLLEVISGFGLILVLIIGGRDVSVGRMPWQSLLGLLLAIMAVYSPVIGLLSLYGSVRQAIPNLDRLDHLLRTVPEVGDRPGARPLREGPKAIELRDVTFAYEGRPVLSGLHATIRRGETIGIVGPTGAGKSSLVSLLLRFYDPTTGAILYDGVDLRDIRHADLMRMSSIVLQEPFLFIDTIANNIRIGRPEASMEELVAAAQAANVHEDILQMEQGYDTVVGHGPTARQVSGGQKQRICVAAALLKNAPLLFLDEATNSLDSVSEQKVQSALDRLMRNRTTFVIAHRFSTLRHADRIIVLEQGRLVGFDAHEPLLATCDTYRRLWASQGGAIEDGTESRPWGGVWTGVADT
jgi:subfamily B ATP-binding cassette protein MsbA